MIRRTIPNSGEAREIICVRVKVGNTANGEPRLEIQHWANCRPAIKSEETPEGQKKARGRRALNPGAKPFVPTNKADELPATRKKATQEAEQRPEVSTDDIHEKDIETRSRPQRNRRKPDRYSDEHEARRQQAHCTKVTHSE